MTRYIRIGKRQIVVTWGWMPWKTLDLTVSYDPDWKEKNARLSRPTTVKYFETKERLDKSEANADN